MTAVDQDGIPAGRVISSGSEQVFDKRQQNGTWDIGVFNTDASASHSFSVPLAQLGLSGAVNVTNLWSGASLGTVNGTFTTTVPAGGVTLISAAPASGTGGTGELVSGQSGQCLDTRGNGTPGPYVYFPGHRGADLALQRRDQPGVLGHVRPVSCGPWAPPSAWTSTTTRPRPGPRSSCGPATAGPTRNGPSRATGRSSASSPGCAWT